MRLASLGLQCMIAGACGCAGADTDLSAPPPAVWLNEANADSTVGTLGDWFEVVNLSDAAVDLTGWQVHDDQFGVMEFTFEAGTTLQPGAFLLVLAQENGLTTEDRQVAPFQLDNAGDCLEMYDPRQVLADAVCWERDQASTYARVPDGGPWQPESRPTPQGMNLQ